LGGFPLVDDKTLIERTQRGDKDAFGELVKRYYKNIYNLAYRMTSNREDSMDVTQEVLYRAYRAIDSFESNKPFLPWIYRITWNICADRGRKIGRTPSQESLDGDSLEILRLSSSSPTPEISAEQNELKDILDWAISQLGDGYRELVVMFHLEALSIKEIAEITGMKETVIKNRLYRGRQTLRKILQTDNAMRFGAEVKLNALG
jgi:RNA polymerase sigma-70 factor (ECF subfamily)